MPDEIFEGAQINGKKFPFIRITIAKQAKILRKFRITVRSAFFDSFFPATENMRTWKRVRSVAFVKDWKWKYLRIIPKELRCSEINIKTAGEIQASFFAYVGEAVKGHDLPLVSLIPSKTGSEPTK